MRVLQALVVLALAQVVPRVAAVTVEQGPDNSYLVTTPIYTANVDRTGYITSIKVGEKELLGAPITIGMAGQKVASGGPGQDDPATPVLNVSFQDYSCPVTYTFADGEIKLHAHNLETNFDKSLGLRLTFSKDAQLANDISLPVLHGLETTGVTVRYSDGSVMKMVHSGPGNPFNSGENGGLQGYAWGRRTFNPRGVYDFTFTIEKGAPGALVLAAPPFTISCTHTRSVFNTADPISFNAVLPNAYYAKLQGKAKDVFLDYQVKDYSGNVADHGQVPVDISGDDDLTIPVTIKTDRKGWMRLACTLKDKAGVLVPNTVTTDFAIVTPAPGLANLPLPNNADDIELDAFLGLRCQRQSISLAKLFPTDYITKVDAPIGTDPDMQPGADEGPKWDTCDSNITNLSALGQKCGVTNFWLIDPVPKWLKNNPKGMEQAMFDLVSRYKDRIKYWMLWNEPNLAMSPADYVTNYLGPLYRAAHKADPDARVIGPDCCGVNPAWLDAVYKAGGKMDIVDMHPYTGHNRGWEEHGLPAAWEDVRKVMVDNGDAAKEYWSTESGFDWSLGRLAMAHQTTSVVRQYPLAESVGITRDHFFYYYTQQMGFISFYLIAGDHMLPGGVAVRVENEQLAGTKFHGAVDVGRFQQGFVYSGTDEDVLMAWALDFKTTSSLTIASKKLVIYDMMGNKIADQSQASAAPRTVALQISGCPIYIHLDHGAVIQSVEKPSPDLASAAYWTGQGQPAPTVTASSESPGCPASKVIQGVWNSQNTGSYEGKVWCAAQSITDSKEAWVEVDLPAKRSIDAAYICAPSNFCGMTGLRSFKVLAFDDATAAWKTVGEVSNSDDSWVFQLKFPALSTSKVKLVVTDLNNGWKVEDKSQYTDMKPRVTAIELFGGK